jgi:hypothetical protein
MVGFVENPSYVPVIDVNLLVVPSNALIVILDKIPVCTPAAFANTDCACGVADTTTFGTAVFAFETVAIIFLVPDNP